MRLTCAAAAAACLVSTPAAAVTYVGSFSGFVDYTYATKPEVLIGGPIKAGDPFRINISFDTSSYGSSTETINDGSRTIYAVPLSYSLTFGSYKRVGTYNNYSLSIVNNWDYGFFKADNVQFSLVGGFVSDSPYHTEPGGVFSSFTVNRLSDSLDFVDGTDFSQLLKVSSGNRGIGDLSFYQSSTETFAFAHVSVTNASFGIAGVPEPATWALMILGFGAVGGAMRHRRRGPYRAVA